MKTISASALSDLLASATPPLLVQVLPEEIFVARRIAGSLNACVYEMTFLETMRKLAPDWNAPIVVYGEGAPSLDSSVALEKLTTASYGNVTDFRGGLLEWTTAGLDLESNLPLPAITPLDGSWRVDPATSIVRWTGRNLFNFHHGTVKLSSGQIQIIAGHLVSAEFTLDMASLACEDLTDPQWNAMLIRHLHDEDFFAVQRFPTATFTSSQAESIAGATEGTPNFLLHGTLTLRGVTKPLSIPAVIAAADAKHLTGQAQIAIDRTEFGSIYGSGKWFAFLGKHVVNDLIDLHLKIQAEPI